MPEQPQSDEFLNDDPITSPEADKQLSGFQQLGMGVLIFCCGFPGLELSGFGFGLPITLQTAILISLGGGLLGGSLLSKKSKFWGGICGLLAGPLSVLAVYFYTSHRASIYNVELVIVQAVASLPALGLYKFCTRHIADEPIEAPVHVPVIKTDNN
ncbi:MAG: hypothetical protein CMJ46_01365 [Planctomyces sp.]|nr:hypothetical protein [Planctomyces sp.]